MSAAVVRPVGMTDAAAARTLVHSLYGGTRYAARTLELVELALAGDDPECAALASVSYAGVQGLLLYGPIAGAAAVIKVHALVAAEPEILTSMLQALYHHSRVAEARMIVCELPHGIEHGHASAALETTGFTREGSVPDFFAEGIALDLFVRRGPGAGRLT